MAPPAAISLLLLLAAAVPAFSSRTTLDFLSESTDREFHFKPPNMTYHNGQVLSSPITVRIIWYGEWNLTEKCIIRDFLLSISSAAAVEPSVRSWWKIPQLYTGKNRDNVTGTILLGNETDDSKYSHGKNLTGKSIEAVVGSHVCPNATAATVYLLLTSHDVTFPDFCQHSCGSHSYLNNNNVSRARVPYAWVGNSGRKCPGMCAFPFSVEGIPGASNASVVKPPNGNVGVDGVVIMVAHELAEIVTNPFENAWFAGKAPARQEIAYLCQGTYGPGAAGGYPGQMPINNKTGGSYNVVGYKGRQFVAPWLWNRYSEQGLLSI